MATEFPIHLVTRQEDPTNALWRVYDPPERLFIQGKPESLDLLGKLPARGLSIVGTREPQARTLSLVRNWVARLRGHDLIILSGMARGIDAVAHAAALEAGLPTIGILGAGLDIPYPEENLELRQRILECGGLIITEFSSDAEPEREHFLLRNRLIAAWSEAVWVVAAGFRSGALNTARWARDHHRTVYATPCFPGDPTIAGNQILLDRDSALPLWGPHSLDFTWPELARARKSKTRAQSDANETAAEELPFPALSDAQTLVRQVASLTAIQGGATVEQLLSWATENSWLPGRFFVALQETLAANQLQDHQGILVTH